MIFEMDIHRQKHLQDLLCECFKSSCRDHVVATHEYHDDLLGLAPCEGRDPLYGPRAAGRCVCSLLFQNSHTQCSTPTLRSYPHNRDAGCILSLCWSKRWARKRGSSHVGKNETMEVLPTMAYTRYGITKACNTILNVSSVDGTRNGSPEFVIIPWVFNMKGLRDPFTAVSWKRFATLGDTSKCDCAVFPYLN